MALNHITSQVSIYEEDGPTRTRVARCVAQAVKMLEDSISEYDEEPDYTTLNITVKRLPGKRIGLRVCGEMYGYQPEGENDD